jgi:hypothetical protein
MVFVRVKTVRLLVITYVTINACTATICVTYTSRRIRCVTLPYFLCIFVLYLLCWIITHMSYNIILERCTTGAYILL